MYSLVPYLPQTTDQLVWVPRLSRETAPKHWAGEGKGRPPTTFLSFRGGCAILQLFQGVWRYGHYTFAATHTGGQATRSI